MREGRLSLAVRKSRHLPSKFPPVLLSEAGEPGYAASEQSPLVIVGGRLVSDVDSGPFLQLTTVYPPAVASLLRRSMFNSDLPRWDAPTT